MSMGVTHAHLGTIWYHSKPSDVPYPPNKFLGWDFSFVVSYSKPALTVDSLLISYIEHTPAILKDFKMEFNLSGIHHAEPAFSGLVESPESQVHGVAFKMSLESFENLTRYG